MKNFIWSGLSRMVIGSFTISLGLLLSSLPAFGALYDFNNGNDNGWTHFDLSAAGQTASTYSFPPDGSGGKAYRIFSPAPGMTGIGQARTLSYRADATYTNFMLTVDILGWDTNLYQAFGVAARVANVGLGQTTGYFFDCDPYQSGGLLQANRVAGEQPRTIAAAGFTFDPTRKYRMVVTGYGSYLAARLFDLADLSTPAASVDVVDATYTGGYVGVFNYSLTTGTDQTNSTSSADSTFDNFSVSGSAPTNSPPASSVYSGTSQVVDSTSMVTYAIDDYTEHTYATNAGPLGSFVQFGITRLFAYPIRNIKVAIVGGTADDIGYVGNLLVTPNSFGVPPCAAVGQVTNAVDVTSQVQTNGNAASLLLRAQENCCCSTGWGLEDGRTNALLHWQVQIALPPKLEVSQSGGQVNLSWTTNSTGFQLETTTNLTVISSWSRVTNPVVVLGDRNVVADLITNNSRMYRLRGPL